MVFSPGLTTGSWPRLPYNHPHLEVLRDIGHQPLPIAGTILFLDRNAMEVHIFDRPICLDSQAPALPSSYLFAMRSTFLLS